MSDNFRLTVRIHEGRGFPQELQALRVEATFAGETKCSSYSVSKQHHTWNATLQWGLTEDQLRKLNSTGLSDCKLVVVAKAQAGAKQTELKLGWVVLNLRTARLNWRTRKSIEGEWVSLTATKTLEVPELRVYHIFQSSAEYGAEGNFNAPDAEVAAIMQPKSSPAALRPVTEPVGSGDQHSDSLPISQGQEESPPRQPSQHPILNSAAAKTISEPVAMFAPTHPLLAPPPHVPELIRNFRMAVDVRSFQAGRKLPVSLPNVYVQATLPPELLACMTAVPGHRRPAVSALLRTQPAAQIAKGTEGALPNGLVNVEFSCGVMSLAALLGRDLRMMMEVWHKDKFRADLLLGTAAMPLAPLLQEPWVDRHLPVMALVSHGVTESGEQAAEERVQVGMLRVVQSLEELGPPQAPTPPARASARHTAEDVTDTGAWASEGMAAASDLEPLHDEESTPAPPPPPPRPAALSAPAAAVPAPAAATPVPVQALQETNEFEAAYEVEVWKKGEEARWRAELRSRESARMQVLEGEWRRREKARLAEAAALRAQFAQLEESAHKVLASAEERERKLVVAEENLARRRKELEREQAARMAEAEAAIRRLQLECEHQLEIERDRAAELARLRAAAEERAAGAEARSNSLEQAFAEFRDAIRGTPELELQRQLAEAREAARRAEERAAGLLRSKNDYKAQVVKLAREIASLYKVRQLEELSAAGAQRAAADTAALRLATEEQARFTDTQSAELQALRGQLQRLRTDALATVSPPASPRRTPPPSRPADKENREPQAEAAPQPAGTAGVTGKVAGSSRERPPASVQASNGVAEIRRLLKEKTSLLLTGSYGEDDPLIAALDQRIESLAAGGS